LLRLDSIELALLPFDFSLPRRDLPLHVLFLLSPRLHLVADQRPAEKPYASATTGNILSPGIEHPEFSRRTFVRKPIEMPMGDTPIDELDRARKTSLIKQTMG